MYMYMIFISHDSYFITLCAYVQQSYVFDCVGLYICMSTKNRLLSVLPLENLLLSVFYYFLTEFKHLQCGLPHPVSRAIHAFPNKM